MIPEFLDKPNVLGIGEIGLNKNTRNESIIFLEHVELAVKHAQQILIHTPHLEDKYQGTRMILDMLMGDTRVDPSRVLVDHVEEHTIKTVLDNGFWAGMTLYPISKCTPQRAADMIEMYGPERLMANSAGDWGPSKPTAIPDLIMELKKRGHSRELIQRIVYDNPKRFFSQSKPFTTLQK
jgi:predicted metal-dependent TIM-barrel fold hydrolase